MKTLEYLSDPTLRAMFLPGIVAGLITVVMCAVVSPLVVVKRLGFIGQGISHSAFGGVGVAAVLAAMGWMAAGGVAELLVIAVFSVGAALGMGWVGRRRETPEDTAIGLFLVGSMAVGAVLVQAARAVAERGGRAADVRSWESILFGSVSTAGAADVAVAGVVAGAVVLALWAGRRPLLFWATDEQTARAFGVPVGLVRGGLMVVLGLVVVTSMKVAGVVLASALLVLPGATALRLSSRLWSVVGWSLVVGAAGVLAGFVVAFEADWPVGPSIVLVQVVLFAGACGAGWVRAIGGRGTAGGASGGASAATVRA